MARTERNQRTSRGVDSRLGRRHEMTYEAFERIEPLLPVQGRGGRLRQYRTHLPRERSVHPVTEQALAASIGVLSRFDDVRNNPSLAHANELLSASEARLVADQVVSAFRYVRTVKSEGATPAGPTSEPGSVPLR